MKEINKEEIKLLYKEKVLFATAHGVVNKKGYPVSYNRTKHRLYIMDEYADIALSLMQGSIYGKEKTQN